MQKALIVLKVIEEQLVASINVKKAIFVASKRKMMGLGKRKLPLRPTAILYLSEMDAV